MGYFKSVYDDERLSHRAAVVFIYLKDRADAQGKCWPGVKTIAKGLKLSPRTVQRALNDLEKAGLVQRQPRYRDNQSRSSNLYMLREDAAQMKT